MYFPSVIRSRRRFTYQEVQALLDGETPAQNDRDLLEPLRKLHDLTERLWNRRVARGSLNFDLPASRVVLELRGKLVAEAPATLPGEESEVVSALVGLGYTQAEAVEAVAKSELPADASVEDKVRLALAYFGQTKATAE